MKAFPKKQSELFWPRVVLRKWLNMNSKVSDFSADEAQSESSSDSDDEMPFDKQEFDNDKESCWSESSAPNSVPKRRRRNSETFRTQYINTKELRICVGTWNLGGVLPPDDLDIQDWLDTDELADIYVIGLQEMVPLNAGNIFGAENSKPIAKWEKIIRENLNKTQPAKTKFKCYSAPSSPSRFKPLNDIIDIEDELLTDTDSDGDGNEVHPLDDEPNAFDEATDANAGNENDKLNPSIQQSLHGQFTSPKKLMRLDCIRIDEDGTTENSEAPAPAPAPALQQRKVLTKTLSGIERIGLSWPEPPMNLVGQHVLDGPHSFKTVKSFREAKSFKACKSFKAVLSGDKNGAEEADMIPDLSLASLLPRKRSPFVMIVSKQMVGIYISVWVRRSLRRHIQNLKVSTVGVGVMGYIGNKGSVSISMSIYQTPFCFICTHLTSGEKEGDELRRNADVQEIHRRTRFRSVAGIGLPKTIREHERIVWLGDLNYRINLPYDKILQLISRKDWSTLIEHDQLVRELKKGCAFDGWTEGVIKFPPTYKFETNSGKYVGEDPKAGRRNPSWCDRILSYGKGMRLLNYKSIENRLSDHRPVTATYMAEVEVFCHRKLQRALTFTDAELEEQDLHNIKHNIGLSHLTIDEDDFDTEG